MTIRKSKPELLAPAGDLDCLKAAILYGADAIYLGRSTFSMRAAAGNFQSPKQLAEAVTLAHENGKKVYLTANTLPHEDELAQFPQFLREAQDAHIDAIILSDLGLLQLTRKFAPDLEIHMSTQTGIVNSQTCHMLSELGVKRVVLAREVSLWEIAAMRAHMPSEMEIEVFVHGAMCMSFSGRCLISAYLTGRDANRGACAQSCRWKYALTEEKRPGQFFPIEEDKNGTFFFNAKDLCMIEHLQELYDAGVDSVKIEGRQKSAYYVAVITNAYRAALDAMESGTDLPQWAADEVYQVSHREYCTGFFFDKQDATQRYESSGYIRNCDVVAVVRKSENGRIFLSQRNRFFAEDTLEAVIPGGAPISIVARDLQDGQENVIPAANHAVMDCSIAAEMVLSPGVFLRKNL